jgi:hypothetical protein
VLGPEQWRWISYRDYAFGRNGRGQDLGSSDHGAEKRSRAVQVFAANERVPTETQQYYNLYSMFSGIVQHKLHHAGQIALPKKSE